MDLLAELTDAELAALSGMLWRDLHDLQTEIVALERCPLPARDLAYGPGILAASQGALIDMVELLLDIPPHRGQHNPPEGSRNGIW